MIVQPSRRATSGSSARIVAKLQRLCTTLATAWLLSLACGPDDIFTVDGTVAFTNIEGGCWLIVDADENRYHPLDLPEAFRQDGLPVRAILERQRDVAGFCPGQIVVILAIERRDVGSP